MFKFLISIACLITQLKAATFEGQLLPLRQRIERRGNQIIGEVSKSKVYLNYGEKVSYPDKKGNFMM